MRRYRARQPAPRAPRRLAAGLVLSALLVAATSCGVPSADGPAETYGLDFSLPSNAHTRGAIVFVVDGINPEVFQGLLADNELPSIDKYFIQRGMYWPRAVANTPSVTLANETSIVTGMLPGHHGVVGIRWWDRNRLVYRRYDTIAQKNTLAGDYRSPTIFERLRRRTTVSIFHQAHRGATKFYENWTSAGPPFFFGWYEFVDRLTLHRLGEAMALARTRREMPAVTVVYLLAPDFRGYASGVSSEPYRDALRHTDRQLGRVLGDLQSAGLLDRVTLALLSDHGLEDVHTHSPLDKPLQQLGLALPDGRLWEETPFENRLAYYRRFNCVLYRSGDRYAAIQVRAPAENGGYHAWPVRPTAEQLRDYPLHAMPGEPSWLPCGPKPSAAGRVERIDLIASVASMPGVEAVAWSSGPNRATLRTCAGEVAFHQPGGRGTPVACRVILGDDPLGWSGIVPEDVLAGRRALSPGAWLEATGQGPYPDVAVQLVAYFRARRAGDLAVFAKPGHDLGRTLHAGHGGLRRGDLHVPLMLAGPGVPVGRREHARTVDLVPTLLGLLGEQVPDDLDGKDLLAVPASQAPPTEPAK
jgi:arylsulfatase A-like enzyme